MLAWTRGTLRKRAVSCSRAKVVHELAPLGRALPKSLPALVHAIRLQTPPRGCGRCGAAIAASSSSLIPHLPAPLRARGGHCNSRSPPARSSSARRAVVCALAHARSRAAPCPSGEAAPLCHGRASHPRAADARPATKCSCETQTAVRAASSQRPVRAYPSRRAATPPGHIAEEPERQYQLVRAPRVSPGRRGRTRTPPARCPPPSLGETVVRCGLPGHFPSVDCSATSARARCG